MAVAHRVRGPAILKIDIALAVQIPDEIALGLADDNLIGAAIAALIGAFHFPRVAQTVAEQRYAPLQHGLGLRAANDVSLLFFIHGPISLVLQAEHILPEQGLPVYTAAP